MYVLEAFLKRVFYSTWRIVAFSGCFIKAIIFLNECEKKEHVTFLYDIVEMENKPISEMNLNAYQDMKYTSSWLLYNELRGKRQIL